MHGRVRSRQTVRRQEEPNFEFEPRAKSYIEAIGALPPDRLDFSLECFTSEAVMIFTQAITPIVEYYTRASFGPETHKKLGTMSDPWSVMDIAEIFRLHFPAFVDHGVRAPVRAFGATFGNLLRDLEYKLGKGLIISSFKIVQLCVEGIKMFPKERPRHTPFIPRVDFEAMILKLGQDRKLMKKCWRQCTKYIDAHIDPPNHHQNGWIDHRFKNNATLPTPQPRPMELDHSQENGNHHRYGKVLGVEKSVTNEVSQGSGRVTERYEVQRQFDREEYLRDLEQRMENKWSLQDDLETSPPTLSAKIKPTSFPGADGWYS